MTSSLPGGLRERKKAKTRAAIREAAMRLFDEQGYASTTVEQIAEAAEVSPSTFFRYFPTKEEVVLTDEYDALLVEAMRAQPVEMHTIDAFVVAMRQVFGELSKEAVAVETRRQQLFTEVPELRSRMVQQTVTAVELLGTAIAERLGRPADDFAAKVTAGAMVGAVLAIMPFGPSDLRYVDLDRIERALILLKRGLPDG